jgi:hypothetical protein
MIISTVTVRNSSGDIVKSEEVNIPCDSSSEADIIAVECVQALVAVKNKHTSD